MFVNCALNLKTFNDNNYQDYEAMMRHEKGRSGFVRHALDVHSIFMLV